MKGLSIAARIAISGVCLMLSHAHGAGHPMPPVEGQWGGDQMHLVINAAGGKFDTGCADGSFGGPVTLAADGSFRATGVFDQHAPGPQRGDEDGRHTPARFTGEVRDGLMTLSVLPEGANQPQVFTLRKGRAVKIVRCL